MNYPSRQQAGQLLGRHLVKQGVQADLVLGLPRGGVVVAAEVALALKLPMDVILVRKIGHPSYREFAVGAMTEHGVVFYDVAAPGRGEELEDVVTEEGARLLACRRKLDIVHRPSLRGRRLILVDDGLATGATMEAAARSARFQQARRVTIAVPVASTEAVERLKPHANEVLALATDPALDAVGSYYDNFNQTSDEEVLALLARLRVPTA